jgi:hypothetical protein
MQDRELGERERERERRCREESGWVWGCMQSCEGMLVITKNSDALIVEAI